jgi:hypothetical protein
MTFLRGHPQDESGKERPEIGPSAPRSLDILNKEEKLSLHSLSFDDLFFGYYLKEIF